MKFFSRIKVEENIFVVFCIIGAFAILSSTMSKNPVLNPFAESLGAPEVFMGFIAAASTLPGVLISFPAGSLSDIWGRRKVLLVSSLIFATAPFFYIFISAWWHLIVVRFYHGFATAIFIPVARATLVEHYPSKRGERISTFTSATIVGRGIAPILGGVILAITVWNFQVLYLTVGVAGITTLFLTFTLLRDKKLTEEMDKRRRVQEKKNSVSILRGGRMVLGSFNILIASSTEAAARYVYGALEFFLIGYLKNVAQLDPSLIGVIMGMQLILIPIMSPLMGRISDRMGRKMPIVAGLILSGLPLMGIPFVTGFIPLLVIAVVYGVGFATVVSSTPALVGDLASEDSYGAAMGFLATIMDVGQMLGPVATGIILASFGYSGSFFSLGAILFGICILFSIFQKV